MMPPAARVALHMADATSYRPPSPRRPLNELAAEGDFTL